MIFLKVNPWRVGTQIKPNNNYHKNRNSSNKAIEHILGVLLKTLVLSLLKTVCTYM